MRPAPSRDRRRGPLVWAVVLVAALFGLATLFEGGGVLLGARSVPYHVVRPVLVFNVAMGFVYLLGAVAALRSAAWGKRVAAFVALANLVVLVAIVALAARGGEVARETLAAMTVRTVVWAVLFAALAAAVRRQRAAESAAARAA